MRPSAEPRETTVAQRPRFNLLSTVALVLVGGGVVGLIRDRPAEVAAPCDESTTDCPAPAAPVSGQTAAQQVRAQDACRDSGYLCAEVEELGRTRVRRWKDGTGTLVVHVPRPDFEDAGAAIELQRAAAAGIRTWNEQPFPILVDLRGDRNPHFSIRWNRALPGTQIGVARTEWSRATGLAVASIELATRNPYGSRVIDPTQIRLTAAHEMGHALGLPHSDSARDVMYPTNTASIVSARDRRTMEVLYTLPDGIEIVR